MYYNSLSIWISQWPIYFCHFQIKDQDSDVLLQTVDTRYVTNVLDPRKVTTDPWSSGPKVHYIYPFPSLSLLRRGRVLVTLTLTVNSIVGCKVNVLDQIPVSPGSLPQVGIRVLLSFSCLSHPWPEEPVTIFSLSRNRCRFRSIIFTINPPGTLFPS